MPRPVKCRKVCHFHNVLEFLPTDNTEKHTPIVRTVDEYETIRLLDKEGYSQEQCAASMQVARTTVQRIYEIARKKIADALEIEEKDVLRAVNEYTDALILLDQYDHQALSKPEGSTPVYRITYEECVQMVGQMKDSFETDVFGVEKEAGKVQGIIAAVYQSVFGQDAYPSLEEKAANLLYFMIKDHPYADGCKRIAASLFLEFLDKNNALFLDGEKRLSDGTLVAITLMIAESKPEEKDVMVKLIMNLLKL